MSRKVIILPTVKLIDEWEKEIDGYEFVFQINHTSGGDRPDWYPVSFRKKDNRYSSIASKFEERPSRNEVEKRFADDVKIYIEIHLKNK